MKNLILATASVLAIGIGGAAVSYAADLGTPATNAGTSMPAASGVPQNSQAVVNPSRDEVRQVQQQLKDQGLYNGKIDGMMGPETKQALEQFQKKNGLKVTATLDQQTMDRLLGNIGTGQGSSTPMQSSQGPGPMTPSRPTSPGASNLGGHTSPAR